MAIAAVMDPVDWLKGAKNSRDVKFQSWNCVARDRPDLVDIF